MNILIKNCNLISMSENRNKIEYGIDILIEDDKIKQIGKNIDEKKYLKVIDASNKYVLPGLINTHTHIPMSIFRESVDGYSTQDWLTQKIWPIEDKLEPDDIYNASLLSCIEMIKTGTTMANDQYFFAEDIIKAVNKTGIRCELTRVVMDSDGRMDQRFFELENLISNYNNKFSNIYVSVGIHGLYTASEFCVQRAINLARKYNLNVHMHYLENSMETTDISSNYNGKNPYEIINELFTHTNSIFAHCVKLSNNDINVFKNLNIKVSHCPISNLKLGCGIADITKMIDNNIIVSLGTDGQGSGSNLDMFETMKFTGLLQKGIKENPKLLSAYEILKLATINGAKALNKEKIIGSIEEGKLADLIIIDLSDIISQPINEIFADIVYNAKGTNVITTIVGGNILMENRKLISVNENEVIKNCKNILSSKNRN